MVAIVIYWQSLSTLAILSWLLWMLSLCLPARGLALARPLGFECAVRAQEMAISPRNLIKLSQSSSKSDERPRAAAKHLSCSCFAGFMESPFGREILWVINGAAAISWIWSLSHSRHRGWRQQPREKNEEGDDDMYTWGKKSTLRTMKYFQN